MSSLIALASALDQDYRDVGISLPCIRLASSCFPPKSRLKFGLRSAIALLRASNDKFSAESQAERVAGQAGYRDVHGHCLQTVKQQCQCWAKLVKAYVACPSVFEEQINSGTMCTPDIPKPANGLEQPDILFAVLSG